MSTSSSPSRSGALLPAPWAVAALLLATSSWGSLFLVGKQVIGVLDPAWFTLIRYALATALLALLVQRFGDAPWRKLRRHWWRLSLLGVCGYGLFSLLVFYGLRLSQPSHGSVIMATMPFTTLALRWALDGQRPALRALLAAALAIAGVATVADLFGQHGVFSTATLIGDALALAGTLGWVIYTRGAASLPEHSPLEYTALTAVGVLPWLTLGTLAATALGWCPAPSPAAVAAVAPQLLYIAVLPTVAAALAFNLGVRRLGAPAGTLFLNMVPVSVIAVRAVLGHAPQANELIGTALVGLALALNAWPARSAGADRRPAAAKPAAPLASGVNS